MHIQLPRFAGTRTTRHDRASYIVLIRQFYGCVIRRSGRDRGRRPAGPRRAACGGDLWRALTLRDRRRHTAVDTVPANRAVVSIGRYAVTLPTCPNWSQSLRYEFTNAFSSYYGCANATNLGLMVASPADLASGRPFTGIDGQPAVSAVQRYLTDRVKPPPAITDRKSTRLNSSHVEISYA